MLLREATCFFFFIAMLVGGTETNRDGRVAKPELEEKLAVDETCYELMKCLSAIHQIQIRRETFAHS